jgi:hypothetical protein
MEDPSDLPAIRASDEERERSVVLLRDAVVSGRLTLEEFSERVGRDRSRSRGPDRRPAGARAVAGGDHAAEAPGALLEAGPPRLLGDTRALVVALAVRHDRARPARGEARRPRGRARHLQLVRHRDRARPGGSTARRRGQRPVRESGDRAAVPAAAGRCAPTSDTRIGAWGHAVRTRARLTMTPPATVVHTAAVDTIGRCSRWSSSQRW